MFLMRESDVGVPDTGEWRSVDINCTRQYYFYSNNNTRTQQINRAAIPMKTA